MTAAANPVDWKLVKTAYGHGTDPAPECALMFSTVKSRLLSRWVVLVVGWPRSERFLRSNHTRCQML